jgi:hypothetical protein
LAGRATGSIAKLPTGQRPDRYDFVELRAALDRSLQAKRG